MTDTASPCCGSCSHWAGRYTPTQLQIDDAPAGSLPVYKESDWGWCECSKRGKWMGWQGHKEKVNSGVVTHHDGACEGHSSGAYSSDSQPPSDAAD